MGLDFGSLFGAELAVLFNLIDFCSEYKKARNQCLFNDFCGQVLPVVVAEFAGDFA